MSLSFATTAVCVFVFAWSLVLFFAQVTWVQPRVLTHDQVRDLQTRLNSWATKVTDFATAI